MLRGRETEQQVVDELLEARGSDAVQCSCCAALPAGLTTRQLEGAEPIVGPPLARGAVEGSFRARVAALPQPVRTGLLLAAVEQSGDPRTLERALERSGVTRAVLVTAQDAGIELDRDLFVSLVGHQRKVPRAGGRVLEHRRQRLVSGAPLAL